MSDLTTLWRQWQTQQEKGQSLVEFALVLIFIIIPFTFALIETSVILYKYVALTNSAREAARTGSIYLYVGNPNSDPCVTTPGDPCAPDAGRSNTMATTAKQMLAPLIIPPPDCNGTAASTTCQITYGTSSSPIPDPLRSTDPMTVTITHTHHFLFGALGGTIDLQAQSSMRIEPSSVISGSGP